MPVLGYTQTNEGITDGTIFYHCTQGKDRTGIASALLLAALGASRK